MSVRRLLFYFMLVCVPFARGLQIPEHDPAVNDRFSQGYASAPVSNTSPDFLAAGLDLSGVGWASGNPRKSFALISPRHYLVATHFGGSATIVFHDVQGENLSVSQQGVANTGFGIWLNNNTDLSLGTLVESLPRARVPVRYPVLDLNTTSTNNSLSAYSGMDVLLYGHGGGGSLKSPRLHLTPVSGFTSDTADPDKAMLTPRVVEGDVVIEGLEGGDSGSPTFKAWTNPDGVKELTLVGNHGGVNSSFNFDNFLGTFQVMNRLGEMLRADGRGLRVVGNPHRTWTGSTDSNIDLNRNWGITTGNPTGTDITHDRYVDFDGASAAPRSITVNTDFFLRGLYFRSTGSEALGHTFGGGNVLSVGRGGVVNYDGSPQTFQAPLRLEADQVWHAGPGGVGVQALDTNGFLLELDDAGTLTVAGPVSGSGQLALGQGEMVLSGSSSYTGDTWVHAGTLRVTGDIAASPNLRMGAAGTLRGTGRVGALRGGGAVLPDTGEVLTAATVHGGGGMHFDFTLFSGSFTGNTALRITDAVPFAVPLDTGAVVRLWLDVADLEAGQRYPGGFFTDADADFLADLSAASLEIWMPDPIGTGWVPLSDYWDSNVTTVSLSHDFGTGTVAGRVLEVEIVAWPDPYDVWVAEVFPEGTPEADKEPYAAPNSAGLINLLAFAHRIDPLEPDMSLRPAAFWASETEEWVFQFRRNKSAFTLGFEVQEALVLPGAAWVDAGLVPEVVDADADGDGAVELLEVRMPLAAAGALRFLRVLVVP